MYLAHYDDKKEKDRSHEITLEFNESERDSFIVDLQDWYSLIPFDNVGYGAIKEEAYENFKKKFFLSLKELNDFAEKLKANTVNYKERHPLEF